MKSIPLILGTAFATLLVGCSSTPVALAPVGPGPFALQNGGSNTGSLQVYTPLVARSEGDDPMWYQHTDYYISGLNGRHCQHIDNTVGYYQTRPRTVCLMPGTYIVKARVNGANQVELPVVIRRGETTMVHLDHGWSPGNAPATQIVSTPGGYPVGWRGDLAATDKAD